MNPSIDERYLRPTAIIDSDHPTVLKLATKTTPASNAALGERHQVAPLEFDGHTDSMFQPFNLEQRRFMGCMADNGTHAGIPVEIIVAAWREAYGEARVLGWIARFENLNGQTPSDFSNEEIWKGD